jgi:phosphate transport system substrate-binding protein
MPHPNLGSRLAVVITATAAVLFVSPAARAADGTLRVGGSTTLVFAVTNAAVTFMDRFKTWKQADPGLPDVQPVIYVTGGGSGFGIKAAANGTIDVGMSSRDINDNEKKALGAYRSDLVGKDALAFAVQVNNPLAKARRNLTSEDVRRIFSGQYRTYRDIDASLPSQEIVLLTRDPGSGLAELLQQEVMGKLQVSPNALQMPSQGALLKKLESNPNAFTYVSAGLAAELDRLVIFTFEGTEPSHANIVNGTYKLARPLQLIVKGETPSPYAKRFVDYMLDEGQAAIAALGFVPLRNITTAKP